MLSQEDIRKKTVEGQEEARKPISSPCDLYFCAHFLCSVYFSSLKIEHLL